MTISSPRVLIVGAGPAGLIAAMSLVQNGISVRIIDELDGPRKGQRGAALQPRVIELFKILDVASDILNEAGPLQIPVSYEMPLGTKPIAPTCVPVYEKPNPSTPYPNLLMLGQNRTEAILRSHLERRYKVLVEFGTTLKAYEQNADSVVAHLVTTCNGIEAEENLIIGWLVGADGPRSGIRRHAGIAFLGETHDNQRFIIGDVHVQSGLSRLWSHRWGDFTVKGIGLRPSERQDDTLFQFIIAGSEVPHDTLMSDHKALLDYMVDNTGKTNLNFGELVFVDSWSPNIRMASKFSEGRVFIVGDAAHIHCTSGGQGIVSCVQDSMNLSWKLALVERGLSPPCLLATYDEERIPVIKEMLGITTATFTQMLSGKVTGWPKGLSELRQFGVNYRWSSIIVDDTPDLSPVGAYGTVGGRPHGGDRAPDATGLVDVETGAETSIFEILTSSGHTVFVLPKSIEQATPFMETLERWPTDTFKCAVILSGYISMAKTASLSVGRVLVDRDNHAYKTYCTNGSSKVVVVRPDGIIGALTSDVSGLEKYLKLVFIV